MALPFCFSKNFAKLSFHSPRPDTCNTCDLLYWQIASGEQKSKFQRQLKLHHLKAEKARTEMKENFVSGQQVNS